MKAIPASLIAVALSGMLVLGCKSPRNPSPYPSPAVAAPVAPSQPDVIIVDSQQPRPLEGVFPMMVDRLVGSEAITGHPGNAVIMFAGVKNRSGEDFDTGLFDSSFRDLLCSTGKVRLVGDRGPRFQAALDLLEYRPDDLVTRATARSLAREAGAGFLLVADIHPAVNPSVPGRYSQTCFRLALHLLSAETGEWVWNDEKDFRFRR